jgi:hypothetical protein
LIIIQKVIKDRWEPAENLLAKHGNLAYDYAKNILKGPFPLGEVAIALSERHGYLYATEIIKGKLPDHMHRIMLANAIKAA